MCAKTTRSDRARPNRATGISSPDLQDHPLSSYLRDVYGPSPEAAATDASGFGWLYWSAPAISRQPTRVWVLSDQYKTAMQFDAEAAGTAVLG